MKRKTMTPTEILTALRLERTRLRQRRKAAEVALEGIERTGDIPRYYPAFARGYNWSQCSIERIERLQRRLAKCRAAL